MLPDINLLPKYKKERSFSYMIFLGGLALAILLTGYLIYQYIQLKDEIQVAAVQQEELTSEKEALEEQAKIQEADLPVLMEEAVSYAEQHVIPTSRLIDQLMGFLPERAYISQYHYFDGKAVIETHFETMTEASSYVAKLDASDFTKNVKVNHINTFEPEAPADENEETETIEMSLFQLLPRYQVTYSFDMNASQLKEGTKEHE
ncbi:hypothetical protein ACFSCZ_19035 [Siminovitchia sediminis]|uniref:Fimbrial assembly protein n=1 Tax=Siminovitchia sediminis TaxID=1274353 RepID=A0ABW4KNJ0_9BACI